MDRAAGAIALQIRQAKAFGDHALARECRVAVHQQRQHRDALIRRIAVLVLLGADFAEHYGIDDLEMRGICRERQVYLVAVELAIRRGAEVILDVAGAFDVGRRRRAALEFMEQRAVRLAHHLRQHVEAAAVRHADHDFLYAEIAAALDDLLERRDQQLAAIEAEALGAGEFDVAEFFEPFRLDQLLQNRAAAFLGETDLLVRSLDALLDPRLLRAVRDVHELDAERLAVGAAADRDDLAQRAELQPEHAVEKYPAIEIGISEAVTARIEFLGILWRLEPERI